MRAINLLDDDARRQEGAGGLLTPTSVAIGGGTLFLVVFLTLGFLFLTSRSTVSDKNETLQAVQQQVAAAEAAKAAAAAAETGQAVPGSEQAQLTAFQTAAASRFAWDTLMGDVAKVLPAGSWLASLNMHQPAPPVAPAVSETSTVVTTNGLAQAAPVNDPTTFVISGFALSNHIVAKVMQQLELVPTISNVSLQSSRRSVLGERDVFNFSMSASLSFGATGSGADQ